MEGASEPAASTAPRGPKAQWVRAPLNEQAIGFALIGGFTLLAVTVVLFLSEQVAHVLFALCAAALSGYFGVYVSTVFLHAQHESHPILTPSVRRTRDARTASAAAVFGALGFGATMIPLKVGFFALGVSAGATLASLGWMLCVVHVRLAEERGKARTAV